MPAFLSKEDCKVVESAIADAEKATSGEIRIHIERHCKGNPMESALKTFHALGMTRTKARNGVLIYVATEDRKLAILGDKGINEAVPAGYWKEISAGLTTAFAAGKAAEGLCTAVRQVGQSLKSYFPYHEDDVNELSDEITFGEGSGSHEA